MRIFIATCLILASQPAIAALIPFEAAVSSLDSSAFDVTNPVDGALNPVERISVTPSKITSAEVGTKPLKVTLSTKSDSEGNDVAVLQFYFDGPSTPAPATFVLFFYLDFTSPLVATNNPLKQAEIESISAFEQTGYLVTKYAPPGVEMIQHDYVARPNTDAGFFISGFGEISRSRSDDGYQIRYPIHNPNGAAFDPLTPILTFESTIKGVPESSTVALAAIGLLTLVGVALRRARRSAR